MLSCLLSPKASNELRQSELQPFMAGIQADVGAIMVGHLWLTELDPADDVPASLFTSSRSASLTG
jgi:hypothetical protein